MKGFIASLWAEALKIWKSKAFWGTLIMAVLIVVMLGFMMFILKDPEFARKYGLIGTKAAITAGKADWLSYHRMLVQISAIMGLLVFGFVTSWAFGREYSDRTVKDILALPVSRNTIVLSKLASIAVWCMLLALLIFPLWYLTGHMLQLEGWDPSVLGGWVYGYSISMVMMVFLCPPVAFFASFGKGFITPLVFVILTIASAEVFSILGHGEFLPWAVPMYFMGEGETGGVKLGAASYVIFALTVAAGLAGTLAWWRCADQK